MELSPGKVWQPHIYVKIFHVETARHETVSPPDLQFGTTSPKVERFGRNQEKREVFFKVAHFINSPKSNKRQREREKKGLELRSTTVLVDI